MRNIFFSIILFCFFAPMGFKFLIILPFELELAIRDLSRLDPKGLVLVVIVLCATFALHSIILLTSYCMGNSKLENKTMHYAGIFCGLIVVSYSAFVSVKIQFIFEGLPIIGYAFLIAYVEVKQRINSNYT